jgi:hypothetical protein
VISKFYFFHRWNYMLLYLPVANKPTLKSASKEAKIGQSGNPCFSTAIVIYSDEKY